MDITTIRDEADYRAALGEIERLMVSNPTIGSEEANRLEVLSVLIDEYERSQFPIDLPTPIDAIKFRMEQMNLEPRDLVQYIGSSSRVSEILNGKRRLTLTMMRALHRGLGIPAAVLLKEEQEHQVEWSGDFDWRRYPIRQMVRFGWMKARRGIRSEEDVKDLMERFAAPVGGIDSAGASMYRRTRSIRSARTMDPYALYAWCTRVRIRALEAPLNRKFSKSDLTGEVLRDIAKLSARPKGPLLAAEAIRELGIHFIVERHLARTHLDGAALFSKNNEPIIALTIRNDRLDSFWFCLLHECAHVMLHLNEGAKEWIDDLETTPQNSEQERQADSRAIEALVPSKSFRNSRAYSVRTPAAVLELASALEVNPAVVAGRIRFEANDYRILNQLVGRGEVRRLFPEVFDGDEA